MTRARLTDLNLDQDKSTCMYKIKLLIVKFNKELLHLIKKYL